MFRDSVKRGSKKRKGFKTFSFGTFFYAQDLNMIIAFVETFVSEFVKVG